MNWVEFVEFFANHRNAIYVLGSYGMALLIFAVEIALVRHRRTIALRQLRLLRDAETG